MAERRWKLPAIALAVMAAAWPAVAGAQAPPGVLDDNPIGAPQLGISSAGDAVIAWAGFAETRLPSGRIRSRTAIFAAARDRRGRLGSARRLSPAGDAARGFALAVGSAGDAAVVLRREARGRPGGPLLVARRGGGGRFARPVVLPGSHRGRQPATAMAPDGTLLVVWLAPARRGCGSVVRAAVARRGRPFGSARRVSGACPHAATPRAALGTAGRGALAWRQGEPRSYLRNTFTIAAAPVIDSRPARARTASRGPVASASALDLAAARDGRSLLVWRDQASVSRAGARGRVLVATIDADSVSAPAAVSAGDRVSGKVRAAVAPSGAALVTWQEGTYRRASALVARRDAASAAFGPAQVLEPCGATAGGTDAFPALGADGRAVVTFPSACVDRLRVGPPYGSVIAHAPAGGAFGPATALPTATVGTGVRPALSAAGPGLVVWAEQGGLRIVGL